LITLHRAKQKEKPLLYDAFVSTIIDYKQAGLNPLTDYPWFVIQYNNQKAGVMSCRLERKKDGVAGFVATVVHQDFRGMHCCDAALQLFNLFPQIDYLVSIIRKENIAAQKARAKTGFVQRRHRRSALVEFRMTRAEFEAVLKFLQK